MDRAWNEGYAAGLAEPYWGENPYDVDLDPEDNEAWDAGWCAASQASLDNLGLC